jgi:dTDP-L-rhamnose 4-epimerase
VYDCLDPQVHPDGRRPDYLNSKAELCVGVVTDRDRLRAALADIDVVYHEAAAVGVGQSMYEIERYVRVNTLGAATLLDLLVTHRAEFPVRKLIVASSMSIYGEGAYRCEACGTIYPRLRGDEQLDAHEWEMRCPNGHGTAAPLGTDEEKPLFPTSIYAITKRDHEEMCLVTGRAYNIPTVALRYFNVYGPRQALTNPYTGVCAIFSSSLLNDQAPTVFEDGEQTRDFVHVSDIVQANLLALESSRADYQAINVGTGMPTSVGEVARLLARGLGKDIQPHIVGRYRAGDIRHCVADISRAQNLLGYQPRVSLQAGIPELLEWVRCQRASTNVGAATAELAARQLIR